MVLDLYKVLGLKRSASSQEIKDAYRLVARRVHPDAGGTTEEFQRVKLAYDILSDPDRRARYNATGDVSETEADRSTAELYSIANAALDKAFQDVVASGRDPTRLDLIEEVARLVRAKIDELMQKRGEASAIIATLQELRSRVSAKDGSKKPTRLSAIFDGKIGQAERIVEKFDHGINQHSRVLEMLSESSFRFDEEELRPMVWGREASTYHV